MSRRQPASDVSALNTGRVTCNLVGILLYTEFVSVAVYLEVSYYSPNVKLQSALS